MRYMYLVGTFARGQSWQGVYGIESALPIGSFATGQLAWPFEAITR